MGELIMDKETIEILLDLLNPLHGSLDLQTYDEKVKEDFDGPCDREYNVDITARMERDLTQAVCILESRLRAVDPDWPPRMSAIDLPDHYLCRGSTGQLFEVQNGQWVRMNPTRQQIKASLDAQNEPHEEYGGIDP